MHSSARILSVLLHPLWMPTLTIVICFSIDPHLSIMFDTNGLLIIYGMVFAMTAVFPLMSALMMARNGLISKLTMPERRERIPAYIITLLYYGLCYYLLRRTPNHPITLSILFGAVLALLLTLLITLRWKISAHMIGIGGLLGALLAVMVLHEAHAPLMLCAALILAGALGTARLLVSDHTPAQVYAGALLGVFCTFGCALLGVYV